MASLLKECKTCIYLDSNSCRWFIEPKEIPEHVKGCTFHVNESIHPLSREIIRMFRGRVVK